MNNKYFQLVIFLQFFNLITLFAQEPGISKPERLRMIREGQYLEAYNGLEELMLRFPRDPDYLYACGVCRVQTGQKIKEAIVQLKEVCQQKINALSWFYLGKAYLLDYQFDEAAEAFDRFKDKATRDEKERTQLEAYTRMVINARDICSTAKRFTVIKADTIPEDKLIVYLNKQPINGRFEKLEESGMFSSKTRPVIKFVPAGTGFVFQSKYPLGKKYKDLYFSENSDQELSDLKNMGGDINSAWEEDFAFFDATGPALYFSSQGHNSTGGLDIFVSYLDKPSGRWSRPQSLGFPVNSPYDEIVYVTIPGTNRSLLASKRNCKAGKVVVYTLDKYSQSTEESINSDEAREIGKLIPGKHVYIPIVKKQPAPPKNPVTVKNNTDLPAEIKNKESYQKTIHEALNYQIRSDSIRRVCDEKKEALTIAKTENEKTRLWQEIKNLDNKADEVQHQADALYKLAREMEDSGQPQGQKSNMNSDEMGRNAFGSKKTKNKSKDAGYNNKTEKPPAQPQEINSNPARAVTYRIQIGVFSKPLPESRINGMTPVLQEKVNDNAATRYYVFLYEKITDAEKGLIRVKEAGFKDAYIIGFYLGKTIPLSRAKDLEKSGQNH